MKWKVKLFLCMNEVYLISRFLNKVIFSRMRVQYCSRVSTKVSFPAIGVWSLPSNNTVGTTTILIEENSDIMPSLSEDLSSWSLSSSVETPVFYNFRLIDPQSWTVIWHSGECVFTWVVNNEVCNPLSLESICLEISLYEPSEIWIPPKVNIVNFLFYIWWFSGGIISVPASVMWEEPILSSPSGG